MNDCKFAVMEIRMPNEKPLASRETPLIDLIWEAEAIAEVIGRTPRQTHHMLAQGLLPARKVGGRWVASRAALTAFFLGEAA